ncbi:MAG: FAD-dependent oxidoreductase [Acetobacteraceae bacterium]|nr:FAD-dependent oxidoreductase [Acetobacteraceae bacterium]
MTIDRRGFLSASALLALASLTGGRILPALARSRAGPDPQPRDAERWRACQALASMLMLVGPNGEDLKLKYLRTLIDDGLPRTTRPKNVLIVGAGIAGLTAGMLLKNAGHRVTILEANANRIGGRIKTFRADPVNRPDVPPPFEDPNLYAEAGAMRLPSTHPLTLAFIDKLGLQRRLFYNVDVDPNTGNIDAPPPAVKYVAFTGETWQRGPAETAFKPPAARGQTWLCANGRQVRRADYARDPRPFNAGFGLTGDEATKTTGALIDQALSPIRNKYKIGSPDGGEGGDIDVLCDGWARMIYDLDTLSMEEYLVQRAGFSRAALDATGTLQNITSRLPLSFFHSYQGYSEISPSMTYWEIVGGTASLPYALLPQLKQNIVMNRRVTRLEWWDPNADCSACKRVSANGARIWVETVPETGGEDTGEGAWSGPAQEFTADVAIITIPLSALRQIETTPLFSYTKRRAIWELHYDAATKVLLEFNRRWWEFTEDDWRRELEAIKPGLYAQYQHQGGAAVRPATNAFGGGSETDDINRFMYYPSHPAPGSKGGVVLASYTWADDAARWDSQDDAERYPNALRGLQEVHGQRIEAFFTGRAQTQSWMRNRYACGEAAVFTPDQLVRLHPAIPGAEGPVHFAGEHTSLKHAWIEGALESGVRTSIEVNGTSE